MSGASFELIEKCYRAILPHQGTVFSHFQVLVVKKLPNSGIRLESNLILQNWERLLRLRESPSAFRFEVSRLSGLMNQAGIRTEDFRPLMDAAIETFEYFFSGSWNADAEQEWRLFFKAFLPEEKVQPVPVEQPEIDALARKMATQILCAALEAEIADPQGALMLMCRQKVRGILERVILEQSQNITDNLRKKAS